MSDEKFSAKFEVKPSALPDRLLRDFENVKHPSAIKLIPVAKTNEKPNGDKRTNGLTILELNQFVNDPFWVNIRKTFLVLAVLLFLALFVISIIIVYTLGCDGKSIKANYTERPAHTKETLSDYLPRKITCKADEECQSYILNSVCNEVCECSPNNILSSDASKCLPFVKEYGSPCEDNIQCSQLLTIGGVCHDGRCICKTGYHYLQGYCWKNIELHNKCYKNEQCFSDYEYVGLECKNSLCECRENYYERLSSGCRRKRKAGESCNIDADCMDKSTCENMRCSPSTTAQKTAENLTTTSNEKLEKNLNCPKGMFEFDNKCVRELGMDCATDLDCNHIKNALCLDDLFCACQPVLHVASVDNRNCLRVPRGKIDYIQRAQCKNNPECGVFGGSSFCQNNKCACKNGTYFEKSSSFCWTIQFLNMPCKDSRDCHPSATHADCVETKSGKFCSCQKGYHPNDLDCFPDGLKVGDNCKNNKDCLFPNSFCNNSNICSCKERHYLENGKCVPGIGTSCTQDSDCAHLNNTECKIQDSSTKLCLCLDNYNGSEDYKYCLPNANYKEKCVESFQCKFPMGDQGECRNNVCECLEGEHYANGKCHRSKFVGDSCSSLSECFSGSDENSVICLKGFCSCNYDYELDNKVCVKANLATKTDVCFMTVTFLVFFLTLGR